MNNNDKKSPEGEIHYDYEDALPKKARRKPSSAQQVAHTWRGQAWCHNLQRYEFYQKRLEAGRSYLRKGAVGHMGITTGRIQAQVRNIDAGSDAVEAATYDVLIIIKPLDQENWQQLIAQSAEEIFSITDLMTGKLSESLLATLVDAERGLFPQPTEIRFSCTCLDWADMCKHVASVLYATAIEFDRDPHLLFTLRGVDQSELMAKSSEMLQQALAPSDDAFSKQQLEGLFGIELELNDPESAG